MDCTFSSASISLWFICCYLKTKWSSLQKKGQHMTHCDLKTDGSNILDILFDAGLLFYDMSKKITWIKAISFLSILSFFSQAFLQWQTTHICEKDIWKGGQGLKITSREGTRKKGSLWQKTRSDEKKSSLYKHGGGGTQEWRRREQRSSICSRFFLLSSTFLDEGRASTLTLIHTHTHTMWTVDSSQGVKVTMQLCFYRCVFSDLLRPKHQTLAALIPAWGQKRFITAKPNPERTSHDVHIRCMTEMYSTYSTEALLYVEIYCVLLRNSSLTSQYKLYYLEKDSNVSISVRK